MFKFEELRIYQESLKFTSNIYLLSKKFPKEEIFGLTGQLRRAAVSISLNVAEGTSRTKKDFRHFLDLSKGSCFECVAILSIARMRNYVNEEEFNVQYKYCDQLSRMISGLKNALR